MKAAPSQSRNEGLGLVEKQSSKKSKFSRGSEGTQQQMFLWPKQTPAVADDTQDHSFPLLMSCGTVVLPFTIAPHYDKTALRRSFATAIAIAKR